MLRIIWLAFAGAAALQPSCHAFTAVKGINDLGQIVGEATRGDAGPRYAFVWDSTNGIQDLNIGPGSVATAINNQGQIVGSYTVGGSSHAFLLDPVAGFLDLNMSDIAHNYQGELIDGGFSVATGINNLGQVVGHTGDPYGASFYWDAVTGFQLIHNPAHEYTFANAINDSQQVVGHYEMGGGGFLWDPAAGFSTASLPPYCWDINNTGQVVTDGAFVWDSVNGARRLPAEFTAAYAISDAGHVVGASYSTNQFGALLWDGESVIPLGQLPGFGIGAVPRAVNASGMVAGDLFAAAGPNHGFVWDAVGGMQDIGSLPGSVQPPGPPVSSVPEPEFVQLGGLLLAGSAAIRRRRKR